MPKLLVRILSFLGSSYLRFVGLSSQIIWVNRSIREELESSGRGFLYAFWHGRQVFLVYLHQGDRLHTLISRSRDGEIIAQVCRSFDLGAVRGSSSRGAPRAVRELLQKIEMGERIAVTPDGPRGPRRQVQPGVLYLAQKTGRPIVPVAYGAKRVWTVKGGWDQFLVPKPYNRIAMVYGEPIYVGPEDNVTRKSEDLRAALDEVTHKADSVAGAGCGG